MMKKTRRPRTREQIKALFAQFAQKFGKRFNRRKKVASSNIHSVGYDSDKRKLEVKFRSKSIYQYDDVPEKVYRRFLSAESKGKFLNKHIKNKYPYTKIG